MGNYMNLCDSTQVYTVSMTTMLSLLSPGPAGMVEGVVVGQ